MFIVHAITLIAKSTFFALLVGLLLSASWWTSPAEAGNWRVAPIRLNFDTTTRSDVVTITNDSEETLTLEVSAMQWTQNQDGQDIYLPATDLIFFPKQLVIKPNNERVVRTGIKLPAVNREKTYRLFIKEVPDRSQSPQNTVAIAIQFGVPVFVKPAKEETAGVIVDAQIINGMLSARIENQGNNHFRVQTITLNGQSAIGETLSTQELQGWYLLSGNSRVFSASLPVEFCRQINVLEIQVDTDRIKLNGRINVDPSMCPAP